MAKSTAALTAGSTTYTINVTLPAGTSIVDTTVGAAGAIAFGPGDNILGPTASGGGTVEVGGFGTADAITASGNVQVDATAVVNGNVTAGAWILPLGQINGTQSAFSSAVAPTAASWTVTNPGSSQGPITLQNGAIASPTPGVYDAVSVESGSSLYLHSGTYFFQSLDLDLGTNLYVDSSHGSVFLYVQSSLQFQGNEKALDASVPDLFMGFMGTCAVSLEAPFKGVFLAPNAPIIHMADPLWVLDPVKKAEGNVATIYGNAIVVDPGETIKPSGFDWSSVPGFPIPPGGWAANGGTNGTGGPGSGATSGGTGTGGGTVISGTLPPSAVSFHLSNQPTDPNAAGGPGIPQTTSGTITPTSQVPFHLPGAFDVGGVLANGTVTITYTSCTGPVVTCTYQGGSSSANPTTVEDLEAGRTATFASCTDGQPSTASRCGTNFSMTTQPAPGWPVSVDLSLDDRACNTMVDLLTPLKTRQMLDSFHWPDPGLAESKIPTVPEMAADGKTPNLYYAWVYLHNTTDLLRLRKMYVHILSRPLYTSELEPYAGQCVQFTNPGDGVGTFVLVLMPGQVYNTILEVQNTAFQTDKKNLNPQDPPLFKAVILRSTTPVDFQKLKASGFRYLDYEGGAIPQNQMKLQGGAVTAAFIDIAQWAIGAVQEVGHLVTTALGDLDALFAGRVNINLNLHVGNSGTNFVSPMALRGWGRSAGMPLGAGGLRVTILENLFDVIPETFSSDTDDSGHALITPAQHDSSVVGGTSVCITLSNDAAWVSGFLMPNEVCNLGAFDGGSWGGVGVAVTAVSGNPVNTLDVNSDQTLNVIVNSPQLSALYGMTDAYKYMNDVAGGYQTHTAHVLVGSNANIIGSFTNGRAFTFGLHLRNITDVNAYSLLGPYINGFGSGYLLDELSSGGTLSIAPTPDPLTIGSSFVVSVLTNNDIVLPDSSIDETGTHREVGTHEFGHFILMNLMVDTDDNSIDDLIGDIVGSGNGSNNNYPTRYVNEGFADYISGQVTGIANYRWLTNGQGDSGKVCIASPCYDGNYATAPSTSNTDDRAGIARVASLIHDAFDGQRTEATRNQDQPDNADPWSLSTTAATEPPYSFTPTSWGDTDSPPASGTTPAPACRQGTGPQFGSAGGPNPVPCKASESVALGGSRLVDFGHSFPNMAFTSGAYLQDETVAHALDQVMVDAGYNWCRRCEVLALHVPENSGDNLDPISLLKLCDRGDGQAHNEDPNLHAWGLPSVPGGQAPPDSSMRLDVASCQTCPDNKFTDGNGQCTVDCPADVVVDGSVAPLVITSYETTTPGVTGDPCAGLFVLEVDHPDQFFARGAVSIGGKVDSDVLSQATCTQPLSLTLADLPASSTNGYVTEQTDTVTGTWDATTGFAVCSGGPSIGFNSAQLTSGPAPICFVTPVLANVSLFLDIEGPPGPPPQ